MNTKSFTGTSLITGKLPVWNSKLFQSIQYRLSSKTEKEIEEFIKELGSNLPYISENGSSIHKLNLINANFPNKIVLSRDKQELIEIFNSRVPENLKAKCKFISKMNSKQQTNILGLQDNHLKNALNRKYTIPFLFEGDKKEKNRLFNILKSSSLTMQEGGRVLNLGDRINKADAMKKIIQMLETKFKCKPKIIAVGDNHNDLEMLQNSDIPCLVKNDKFLKKNLKIKNLIISKQAAPEGWVEIVKLALEKIKLKE